MRGPEAEEEEEEEEEEGRGGAGHEQRISLQELHFFMTDCGQARRHQSARPAVK